MDEPQDGGHRKLGLVPRLARHLREVEARLLKKKKKKEAKKVKAKNTMTSCSASDQELSLEGETPDALLLTELPEEVLPPHTTLLLAELPEEVLLPILEWLDARDLVSITAVSSSFRRLALEDSYLPPPPYLKSVYFVFRNGVFVICLESVSAHTFTHIRLWRAKCRGKQQVKQMEHTWHQHFIFANGLDLPQQIRCVEVNAETDCVMSALCVGNIDYLQLNT
jgi:hypothetical protein